MEKRYIEQEENPENIKIEAGESIEVRCNVTIPNLSKDDIQVQVYCGRVSDNGTVDDVLVVPMKFIEAEEEYQRYHYSAKIQLQTGGNYGYTFRVMPQNEMLLDSENLDLVKWNEK